MAMAEGTECVVVAFRDGGFIQYTFDERPNVSFDENNVIISTSDASALYPFSSVKEIYFDQINSGNSIADMPEDLNTIVFNYSNKNAVVISGMEHGDIVSVYAINGILLGRQKGNENGHAEINLADLPSGVYIINVNNKQSIKIQKK